MLSACVGVSLLFSQPALASEYQILISKQNSELLVEKAGEVVKRFHIATGKGGKGTKRRQGDSKTPVGTYRIMKFKDSDRFNYFIQLDYPNLIDAWYGYKNKIISGRDFKRIARAYKNRETPPRTRHSADSLASTDLARPMIKSLPFIKTWIGRKVALRSPMKKSMS